jgi:formylglycine-generating enzyme required for sulfatase activity
MEKRTFFYAGILIVMLLVQSCTKSSGPTEVGEVAPTSAPITTALAAATPVLISINLAGPIVGTTMLWVDNSTLLFVPGGEFTMGGGGADYPEHRVNESSFWIYRNKVTNRQYALCLQAGQCSNPTDPKGVEALSDPLQRDMPVVGVNWDQSQAYCKWTQGRLPTEAEWEKTARGPDGNIYPWGTAEPTCELLNFNGCVGKTSKIDAYPKGKSYYDALDTAGNVFEWVADWYDPNYYTTAPIQDPPGPTNGTQRSIRSSSYLSFPSDVPPAKRNYLEPEKYRADLGFRCVVEEPGSFAPFCQTSIIYTPGSGQNHNPNDCTTPNIESPTTYCQGTNGVVQINVGSGRLASSDNTLHCNQEGNIVVCSGNPETGANVTVCNECAPPDPGTPTGDCLDNYHLSTVGHACDYTPAEPPGGVCPPGATPMIDGDISACVYNNPNNDLHLPCPVTTYIDGSVSQCVSTGLPGTNCLPGYTYSVQLGCCQSVPQGTVLTNYPGCSTDEYFDPLLGVCVSSIWTAAPQTGCTTVKLDTPSCGHTDPGRTNPCTVYTDGVDCKKAGCVWNGFSCN